MKKQLIWINFFVLFLFILDRFLKKIALNGATKKIYFFNFSLSTNPNIALGIPLKGIFFYVLLTVILFWIILKLIKSYQQKDLIGISCLTLVLTGAFSNLLDRWQNGFVIDYFDLPLFTVFNMADLMILIGIIILIWQIIILDNHRFIKKR